MLTSVTRLAATDQLAVLRDDPCPGDQKIEETPVYVTSKRTNRGGQDVELTRALISKYKLALKGLVFRVAKNRYK
jgi:hypothetical protein